MGSRGTSRFTDYPGTSRGSSKAGTGGSGGSGNSKDTNICEQKITDVPLEEVARLAYFKAHAAAPAVGTAVKDLSELVGGRVGVEVSTSKEVVGLLPTQYNYLLQCVKQGYSYQGSVTSVSHKPILVVRVNLEFSK